jgi:hypothetical protein
LVAGLRLKRIKKRLDIIPFPYYQPLKITNPDCQVYPGFHYERNGDGLNTYFEQTSEMLGTEEIVMYNKLGECEMTVA